jgi:hypothetical protein
MENYVSLKRKRDKLFRTQNKPGAKLAKTANGIKHFFLKRRQFEPEADNLLSSIKEIKNEGNFASTPHTPLRCSF